MSHLSQKQCIDLVLDLVPGKKAANLNLHIEACPACNKLYNSLLPVIKPGINAKSLLSKNLKNRILKSAVQLRDLKTKNNKYNFHKYKSLKSAFVITSIAATAAAVFIGIISFIDINSNGTFLQVARMYGKAEINAIPARIHDVVSSGNTISTDDDSIMMLRSPGNHKITIFSKSQMTVEKAKMDDSKDIDVNYSLDNGTVYNKHNEENSPAKYAFTTPNAIINAEDADMMLQVSDNTSRILLIKGKITVQDPNSSKNMIIDSPGKYIISDGIKTEKQNDAAIPDSKKIDEALTINDNADEAITPAENFETRPVYNDNYRKVNKSLINTVKFMLSK
jgi:hypothetical protein